MFAYCLGLQGTCLLAAQRRMDKLNSKISRQARDIIQKYASGLFRNSVLEFYGIKSAKIKELINVELPVIEVGDSTMDYIFLLEDSTYLHIEFQTAYSRKDLTRFAAYDLRLYERDGRKVITIIIYSAEVKKADTVLDIGSLVYSPQKVMMAAYNGDNIYKELEHKISNGIALTDIDLLNLVFLPLMSNEIPRDELATKSIELAKAIPEKTKRDICIASVFAFGSKYLSKKENDKLLEVLKMTDLATMLLEDALENKAIETAKIMLEDNVQIEFIIKYTGLDEYTIRRLKEELNS